MGGRPNRKDKTGFSIFLRHNVDAALQQVINMASLSSKIPQSFRHIAAL